MGAGDEAQPGEPGQGDEVELSNAQLWDIVDFRISKCGRCLIYVFEHVDTQERKSLPADFMIGGDWNVSKGWWHVQETYRLLRACCFSEHGIS